MMVLESPGLREESTQILGSQLPPRDPGSVFSQEDRSPSRQLQPTAFLDTKQSDTSPSPYGTQQYNQRDCNLACVRGEASGYLVWC